MPRKLPWLKDAKLRPKLGTKTLASPSRQHQTQSPTSVSNDPRNNARAERSRKGRERGDRTPSTSPPPQPPTQEFMKDGLDEDDIWVMVEDEFLDTARNFTRHLHHAEYHRLKRLAQARNTSAIQNMSRPVVPYSEMSTKHSKIKDARMRADKQNKTLQAMGAENVEIIRNSDDSEDDATPWMFDPYLSGLMAGNPSSSSQQLAKLAGPKSKTRAAAGFQATKHKLTKPSTTPVIQAASGPKSTMHGLAQEIELTAASDEEADSDDLDGPALRTPISKSVAPLSTSSRERDEPRKEQRKTSDPLLGQQKSSSKRLWAEEDESSGDGAFRKPRLADAASRTSKPQPTASDEPVSRSSRRVSSLSRTKRPSVASMWAPLGDEPVRDNTSTRSPLSRRGRDGAKDEKLISIDEIPTFLF